MKHLYFGDGKGQNHSCCRNCRQAAGSKSSRCCFVQFLKRNFRVNAMFSHTENVTLPPALPISSSFQMNEKEKGLRRQNFHGILTTVTLVLTEKYDMVVFDEIIDAINAEMLTELEVVELHHQRSSSMEIIMTGHNPSQKMIDLCDYVTEFKKIKHPYDWGISRQNRCWILILSLCR